MKKLAALVLFTVLFSFAAAPVFAAPAPKAGWPQQLKFMAGPPGGNWFALGSAFSDMWSKNVIQTTSSSGGGVSNILNTNVKKGDFGFSVTSLLGAAVKGEQDFLGRPTANSVIMANLYTQYTYFVMNKDFAEKHKIKKVGDIFDKKIPVRMATLKPGTASEFVVKTLFLKGYGITYKDIKKMGGSMEFASYEGGADLLADGHIDLFIFSVGKVASIVMNIESKAKVTILPVEDSALKALADEEGYETFVVPDDVGGRFSVLTAVGLLPIAVSGADIDALMQGAATAQKEFDNDDLATNDCYKYAALRNILYRKGKTMEVMVSYEPAYTMMSEWFKQLFAESEGKDNKGIFPASVIFSTDLHSLGQYIQDGRRTMFETVVLFDKCKKEVTLGTDPTNVDGLNFLSGKTMGYVNQKAFEGTVLAHNDGGVPNIVLNVPEMNESELGYLIYFFEKACAISGYMLGVNPFNQPGVESYKKNMFALLGKPGYEDQKAALEARLK